VWGATTRSPRSGRRSCVEPCAVDIGAGEICDFGIDAAVTDAHSTVMTFPIDRRGDQREQYVGQETVVVTNTDDDISVTIQEGVRIADVYHADGTIDPSVDGISVGSYFATGVGGPPLMVTAGRVHDMTLSDFTTIAHEAVGRTTDLCAALAL
jgi:hypothetical protein